MGNWKYSLRSGGKLRVKINSDDKYGTLEALIDCYKEIRDNFESDDEFLADDCNEYIEDITDMLDDDNIDDDDVNYQLSEFYDMCDNLGIWVKL